MKYEVKYEVRKPGAQGLYSDMSFWVEATSHHAASIAAMHAAHRAGYETRFPHSIVQLPGKEEEAHAVTDLVLFSRNDPDVHKALVRAAKSPAYLYSVGQSAAFFNATARAAKLYRLQFRDAAEFSPAVILEAASELASLYMQDYHV